MGVLGNLRTRLWLLRRTLPSSSQTSTARSTTAVSYTHLDVYKRQVAKGHRVRGLGSAVAVTPLHTSQRRRGRRKRCLRRSATTRFLEAVSTAPGRRPVSYTHLDVYKRQVLQLVAVLLQRLRHSIAVNCVDVIGGRPSFKRESPHPDALPNASGRVLQHQEVPVFACG